MTNVKTMVWELEGIYSFEETLFKNYDRQRRKKEFELLKELSRDSYKTNDIWQDSIRIPVFNSAKEKEFTIQIKNAINYYEEHEKLINETAAAYKALKIGVI